MAGLGADRHGKDTSRDRDPLCLENRIPGAFEHRIRIGMLFAVEDANVLEPASRRQCRTAGEPISQIAVGSQPGHLGAVAI